MKVRFFILLLLIPFYLKAQQNTTPTDTSQQQIQAIPLVEIPSEAERLIQKINKDYQQEIYKSTIVDVQKKADSLKTNSSVLVNLSDLVLDQEIPYFVLETVLNRWSRLIPLIEKEESKLKAYSSRLTAVNDDLIDENNKWLLTKTNNHEDPYPEVIEKRIDEIIGKIDSIKLVLNDSLSNCLSLQNTLVDIQITAESYLKNLADYKTQTLNELLATREPPIWAIRTQVDSTTVKFDFETLYRYSQEDVTNYFTSQQGSILTIMVIFIIFWLALLWMKSKYNELQAKEVKELELGKYIFSRSATSAFLFAMIIQSLALTQKPYAIELLITFVIFLLFLLIIPGLVIKALKWSLYPLSFLYLLVNFDLLIFHSENTIRFVTLFESFSLLAFLAWFLRNETRIKPPDSEKTVWYNFLSIVGPIFFILIVIAVISNLIGFVYLSRSINKATVNSSLIWLLLIAAYRIIEGLSYLFLETNFALRSRIVLSRRKDILRLVSFIFKNGIFLLWLYYSLEFFLLKDLFFDLVSSIWNFGFQTETIDLTVGKIISFIFILILGLSLASFVKILLQVEILSRFKLSRGIPLAIASITNYVLIVIGFFVAMGFAGFDLSKISFIVGALGVGIGFGLQNVVSNFISGLILIFERPIAIGDIIIVENIEGTVTSIGIRSSKVLQYNGDEEIIPNAILISGRVTNRTLANNQRRFIITIHTSLDTVPEQVLELMKKAGSEVEGVLSYPEPKAYFQGIFDQSLKFSLYYWVGDNILDTVSETNLKIHQYLREAGIQIPIPRQIEYHVKGLKEDNLSPKQQDKKEQKDENEEKDEQS